MKNGFWITQLSNGFYNRQYIAVAKGTSLTADTVCNLYGSSFFLSDGSVIWVTGSGGLLGSYSDISKQTAQERFLGRCHQFMTRGLQLSVETDKQPQCLPVFGCKGEPRQVECFSAVLDLNASNFRQLPDAKSLLRDSTSDAVLANWLRDSFFLEGDTLPVDAVREGQRYPGLIEFGLGNNALFFTPSHLLPGRVELQIKTERGKSLNLGAATITKITEHQASER